MRHHLILILKFSTIHLIVLLQACTTGDKLKQILTDTEPTPPLGYTNVLKTGDLPQSTRRVAILPIYHESLESHSLASFDAVFTKELGRTLLFEVVPVSRSEMESLFQQAHFSSVGIVPDDLLSKLKSHYGVQAVILTDLTHYEPYPPLGLGIRSKLVDIETAEVTWAFDDLFDAGNPQLRAMTMKYAQQHSNNPFPLATGESSLQSPLRFSQFAAHVVFSSLPKPPAKYNAAPPRPEKEPASESQKSTEPAVSAAS